MVQRHEEQETELTTVAIHATIHHCTTMYTLTEDQEALEVIARLDDRLNLEQPEVDGKRPTIVTHDLAIKVGEHEGDRRMPQHGVDLAHTVASLLGIGCGDDGFEQRAPVGGGRCVGGVRPGQSVTPSGLVEP